MIVICEKCSRRYDDEHRWTICPHGPLSARHDAYCSKHDLAPCPFCDPSAVNPLVRPESEVVVPEGNYVVEDADGERLVKKIDHCIRCDGEVIDGLCKRCQLEQ